MGEWLKPSDVAKRLQVTERTVRLWLQSGKIPAVKLGRGWRVHTDALSLCLENAGNQRSAGRMSQDDRRLLRRFAAQVKGHFPQAAIWAFGSRSRGDAQEESDFDICVVLPEKRSADETLIEQIAWELGFEQGCVVMPLVLSRQEFEEGPMAGSPLFVNIRREGVAA